MCSKKGEDNGDTNNKALESSTWLSGTRAYLLSNGKTLTESEQISDRNVDCDSLELIIDGIRRKMHEFRTMLNPDSHLFTSNNDQDVRSFALEMMDYLYSLKFEPYETAV